ncbi:hypothetical protein GCM10027059_19560 [Myceligenerans halotolerans]
MGTKLLVPVLSCAVATLLAGCIAEPTVTNSTPSASLSTEETGDAASLDDVTAELQAAVGDVVTLAEVDGDRLTVQTTIVDPRGDGGSQEAQLALDVCEKSLELGYQQVSVMEADGTTFVLAGHPAYGEDCTEV